MQRSTLSQIAKSAFKRQGGSQAGWVWYLNLNIKKVLVGHTVNEGVFGSDQ